MKKFVLKLDLHDDKEKRKALKTVASLPGIDAIAVDLNGKKLTVIGTADPVLVVSKLRKYWQTDMISVEVVKKEEPKKEEPKKEEGAKKEEPPKKEEEPKKEGEKKEAPAPAPVPDPVLELIRAQKAYNPYFTKYYYVPSMEENPNACVIC